MSNRVIIVGLGLFLTNLPQVSPKVDVIFSFKNSLPFSGGILFNLSIEIFLCLVATWLNSFFELFLINFWYFVFAEILYLFSKLPSPDSK